MSQENFVKFLSSLRTEPALLEQYDRRNLSQLLFHARNEGFAFTVLDVEQVVGRLEASVIVDKDQQPFDGSSTLWRAMWGRRHLDYVVNHLVARHTDEELAAIAGGGTGGNQ